MATKRTAETPTAPLSKRQGKEQCAVVVVPTHPFEGQRPGTSGLRKKTTVFQQKHYVENFVQSIFNALSSRELEGSILVVGGDGRFYNDVVIQIIVRIAAANGVGKIILGKDGIFSTPALSHAIRKEKAYGGIILTASHNPGGPLCDFGIKYNVSNGGPAPSSVTEAIYQASKVIAEFRTVQGMQDINIHVENEQHWMVESREFVVQVTDPVKEYCELMTTIFDVELLKEFIKKSTFRFHFDALHAVTGPYAHCLFVDILGMERRVVVNGHMLPDFGGGHPDPNRTYAKDLYDRLMEGKADLGAASDGDGDRNMIMGSGIFVTPSDSVAVIADHAMTIPYFQRTGLRGCARSMPTSGALDRVAARLQVPMYETPTGWKFFGNLMDAQRLSICGEESFGTGSDHIREKDGLWAVLAWLSILAHHWKQEGRLVTVQEILYAHWKKYGRNVFLRYDYEELESDVAQAVMDQLLKAQQESNLKNVEVADEFAYTDPVDGSVTTHQGFRFCMKDGSRIIFRRSGTGSSGATLRLYMEQYVLSTSKELTQPADKVLESLVRSAVYLAHIEEITGRKEPTVIT